MITTFLTSTTNDEQVKHERFNQQLQFVFVVKFIRKMGKKRKEQKPFNEKEK